MEKKRFEGPIVPMKWGQPERAAEWVLGRWHGPLLTMLKELPGEDRGTLVEYVLRAWMPPAEAAAELQRDAAAGLADILKLALLPEVRQVVAQALLEAEEERE